jgi:hypothetical protein
VKTTETFQDQLHIDLFVFFSVFFSCFFLFLSGTRIITLGSCILNTNVFLFVYLTGFLFFPACVVLWKLKQMGDLRRARNRKQLFKFSVPSIRTIPPPPRLSFPFSSSSIARIPPFHPFTKSVTLCIPLYSVSLPSAQCPHQS